MDGPKDATGGAKGTAAFALPTRLCPKTGVAQQRLAVVVGPVLALGILAVDIVTPLGVADPILYVLPIVVSFAGARFWRPSIATAICLVLLLAGYFLSPTGIAPGLAMWNRTMSGVALAATGILVAISLRLQQDAADRQRRDLARIAGALEASPDAVVVIDERGLIRIANSEMARVTGGTPDGLVGQPISQLIPEALRDKHAPHCAAFLREAGQRPHHAMLSGQPVEMHRADGQRRLVEVRLGRMDNGETWTVVSARDVTERQTLQERFEQSRKMEALGRLAGGVAHDFNNLLTVMMGFSDLVLSRLPTADPARTDVEEIASAARRAASLTQQLLAFSRRQVVDARPVDLNGLVLGVDRMLRRTLGEDIEIVTVPGGELWSVRADAGQLEQILLNLAINARDAMPRGGTLIIETENVRLDSVYVSEHPDARRGDHVLLAVSDSGSGMTRDVLTHIFEPFFTTKEAGAGTGLGLATVYGIVKQFGGHISVYSEAGTGSTFRIYLPRWAGTERSPEPSVSMPVVGGSETLLVVEDEPHVRGLAVRSLREQGYTVLEAGNGVEALERLREFPGLIHAVIADVVMPKMGGVELSARLREQRPDIRVVLMSGYTDQVIASRASLDFEIAFVEKPFSQDQLLHKIRAVLDQPAA